MRSERDEPGRVLVVDDDAGILKIYRSMFGSEQRQGGSLDTLLGEGEKRSPWTVTEATQGADAVHQVERSLQQQAPFCCALIDVRMPPGIDGIETARRIRALDPSIFIAIVTAYSDRLPSEVEEIIGGNFTMVRKPFYSEDLLELVGHYATVWQRQHHYLAEFGA